ncbi:hypothetical protein A3B39_03160 [Candidatus Daviesbacteria bacterium RIFCSPLOWO2_01_FULL_37_10]|nr:MAG: hypothetical protein A3B39_03160 [Candidatus Daviesbacteria bacterium RIFCSPLOWO2_01_FULL_37_10]
MSNEREYNPIDPFSLPKTKQDAYFDRFREIQFLENQVPNTYKGSKRLLEFMVAGNIGLGAIIRVNMYAWGRDPHYMITPEGLIDILHNDDRALTPEQALDEYDQPNWEINGHDVYCPPS